MMKHFRLLLTFALLLSLVVGAQAFEKTTLVEYFTNTGCGPCAGQHDPIENMLGDYTRTEIAFICYHVSWPSSTDGYYQANVSENSGRWNYYGVGSVPWFVGEGLYEANPLSGVLPQTVLRIADYTPYDIQFDAWPEEGSDIPITATVTCAEATSGDIRFNIVLVDKMQVVPAGSNGITDYKYNMIDMAYTHAGQAFTSAGGNEELEFNYTFSIPANNSYGNLAVVAYVQNYTTGEIMQSRYIASPEVIIQGTVSHAITGLPLWLAVVELNDGLELDVTGENGNFAFDGLSEGNYYFDVYLNGYDQISTEPQFLNFGQHQFNLEMVNEHETVDMIAGIEGAENFMGSYAVGNTAYFTNSVDGLMIVDITDVENLETLAIFNIDGDAQDVVVDGDYAYVASTTGIYVVDVSNPESPSLAGSVAPSSTCFNLVKSGNSLYVAGASAGLVTIDVTTPSSPSIVSEFDTPGYARDVYVSGNYAYMADGASGLTVLDISTPGSPSVAGSVDTDGYANGIDATGSIVVVADDTQGADIIDISNPTSPAHLQDIQTTGRAKQVVCEGDYAYIAEYSNGLYIYDVSNPGNVTVAGYSLTPGTSNSVFVSGSDIFLSDSRYMLLFDGSNLASPAELTLTPTSSTELPTGGGSINYDVHLQSFVGASFAGVQYWETAVLPNGGSYGPWSFPVSFNVTPFMNVSIGRSVSVPAGAPAGQYQFVGHVGWYGQVEVLQDSFAFTKSGQTVDGSTDWKSNGESFEIASDVSDVVVPAKFELEAAYPNPFNPSTTVFVNLPQAADLTVSVFNVLGQQVAVLADQQMNAGRHELSFNAAGLTSGLYFIRATVPGEMNQVQKVMLVR